ncbi:MAG: phosphatidate cytidylyltransferase [Akkermansiaceae bacterium]|jgi:phosphatidate cytidylyltransferase
MAAEEKKPSKAEVFRARLTSTLILWAIVTAVFVSQNAWAFFGLVAFLTVAGAIEFRGLFAGQPGGGCRTLGLLAGLAVVLPLGAFLANGEGNHDQYLWEFAGLTAVVVGSFFIRFRHGIEGRESVDAVGDGLLAYVYVPVLFGSFVFRILFVPVAEGEVPGGWLLLMMIAAAKFTDMGAYVTGSLIGKHKMAPHLSPAKTWEGFFGALGFAQLAAWSIWAWGGDSLSWLAPVHVFVLALLIGLVSVAGDLAESILKRSLEVKDSGSLMPGIGGILDLIDSLCFAAPVTYFYLLATGYLG